MSRDYLQHARRHLRGGTDPLKLPNDWAYCTVLGVSAANDAGAPGSPTPINVPINAITATSDTEGDVYALATGAVNYLHIKQAGSYRVRAIADFGEGHSNYGSVGAFINVSSGATYDIEVVRYSPLSYPGDVGGGILWWEQLLKLDNPDGSPPATVYPQIWQNSGGTLTGIIVNLFVSRIT